MEKVIQYSIIDAIITKLSSKDKENLLQLYLDEFSSNDYSEYNKIVTLLGEKNIISPASDSMFDKDYYKLTSLGREIKKIGGWAKYLEQENLKEKEVALIQHTENKKLNYETKLAKWQVKTFWPLFIVAVFGGICGIISLIIQIADLI